MDLILWRHAEANDTVPDMTRNLTAKGHRQAERMASWLHLFLPDEVRILSSPANRTRQTADALDLPYEINGDLAPDCSAQQLLAAAGWPDGDGLVIVVGHNPAISEAAGLLFADRPVPLSMRKGAAWWFSSLPGQEDTSAELKMALMPSMLKKITLER